MKRMISRWVKIGMVFAGLCLASGPAMANNVVVTNTNLRAPIAGKVQVQFDLAWDNSWRDGVNYDACWVFMKYSTNFGTNWSHATLGASGTNPAGFTSGRGTNLEIVVPEDKMGAFIQRSVEGTGTVANTWVQLVWDFAGNGVSQSQSARVKVFAIEMVYVPQGSFYAGDGSTNSIQIQFEDGTNGTPFLVTNENYAIILGGGAVGSLGNNNNVGHCGTPDDFSDTNSVTLPAAFPKGFAAFYLMKTEISQRQYCDFLNTLTPTQQGNRSYYTNMYFNSGRNFIKRTSNSPAFFGCDANTNAGVATNAVAALLNETDDGEWVPCNYLSWLDGLAYLDWAALRPYTELEFEKACRGTNAAVKKEYAWGTINIGPTATSLISSNTASEIPNRGNCNYTDYLGLVTPYRVGSYANASSIRTNAGAGYYGALDLSGSLMEYALSVGNGSGRVFTGVHGDGSLDVNGSANVTGWSTGYGWGPHGGGWARAEVAAQVSCRTYSDWAFPDRSSELTVRGVRTAPASIPSPGGAPHDAYCYGGQGDGGAMDQMSQDKSLYLPAGTIIGIH